MALLQLIGWLAYPVFFPVPLLALNCLSAWLLGRGRPTYVSSPAPPPLSSLPRVWFALASLLLTGYVVLGFFVLAWQVGAVLLSWVAIPSTITLLNLSAMREARRGSREQAPTARPPQQATNTNAGQRRPGGRTN